MQQGRDAVSPVDYLNAYMQQGRDAVSPVDYQARKPFYLLVKPTSC